MANPRTSYLRGVDGCHAVSLRTIVNTFTFFKSGEKDAVSLTKTGFKSKYKKVRALSDSKHRFVPFRL